MSNVLDRILETKRAEVAARKATTALADLDAMIATQSAPRGFRAALDAKAAAGGYGLIYLFNNFGSRLFSVSVQAEVTITALFIAIGSGILAAALPARRRCRGSGSRPTTTPSPAIPTSWRGGSTAAA